jgi:predicted DNA-binding transcriptional regulator YafY
MKYLYFMYQNAKGELKARTVLNAVEKGEYIQGFSIPSDAFRTFRQDRIIEFVATEQELID